MRQFIKALGLFIAPFILIVFLVFWVDVFKILGYQDYYANQKVVLNREMICTKTFNHYNSDIKFNSFIFGNSRSQAYKCKKWAKHLTPNAIPFHFDASAENIWGILKKIEYLDQNGSDIDNVLIVLDRKTLSTTTSSDGHLFIAMPSVSKLSKMKYYFTYLEASLNIKFLLAYTDYTIFKTHREYMGHLINSSKYDDKVNEVNCDIWYGYDEHIKNDSLGYYNELIKKGIFHQRLPNKEIICNITSEEVMQLKKIKELFTKHNTNYRIVVSPIYTQIPLEQQQLNLLNEIFEEKYVSDFSGKNKFTEPTSNYYEESHYKPYVANEIMEVIYNVE